MLEAIAFFITALIVGFVGLVILAIPTVIIGGLLWLIWAAITAK